MLTKPFLHAFFVVLVAINIASAQSENAPRFEVGAHFSSITIIEPSARFFIRPESSNDFRTEPGVGGRFTYNFTDSIAGEAEVNFFPNNSGGLPEDYTAGRAIQGLLGVKAGKRFERFGIFGRARPGFVRFSRAFSGTRRVANSSGTTSLVSNYGRTNFAMDIGGTLEIYPSRRIVTRFDIGDTIIRYSDLTFEIPPSCSLTPPFPCITQGRFPGRTTNNFQFSAGIGLRF